MTLALAIIFAFMIFLIIMRKGNLLFINLGALLMIIAFCFAVGYGMAVLLMEFWRCHYFAIVNGTFLCRFMPLYALFCRLKNKKKDLGTVENQQFQGLVGDGGFELHDSFFLHFLA